jgi:hypothetical protein
VSGVRILSTTAVRSRGFRYTVLNLVYSCRGFLPKPGGVLGCNILVAPNSHPEVLKDAPAHLGPYQTLM